MKVGLMLLVGVFLGLGVSEFLHRFNADDDKAEAAVEIPESHQADEPHNLVGNDETEDAAQIEPEHPVPSAEAPLREGILTQDSQLGPARAGMLAMARRQEEERLKVAGFSDERIAYLRRRVEELQLQRSREVYERQQKGLPPDPLAGRYLLDGDLDLREEIGEEEYVRYREATGRPITVPVKGIIPDSSAQMAGLKEGDEIVAYAGKRVFNDFDLDKAASTNQSLSYVVVDVLRDGMQMQIFVPPGPLGLRKPSAMELAVQRIDKLVETRDLAKR